MVSDSPLLHRFRQSVLLILIELIHVAAPIFRPACQQVYNLFHPTDPVAARIEPLLSARFSMLPPINIPRYQKYPLGNGQPYHLCKSSSNQKFMIRQKQKGKEIYYKITVCI